MKQLSLASVPAFERRSKTIRRRVFLEQMNRVVPWAELVAIIEPHAPKPGPKGGRPPFAVQTLLRIHCLQQWFNLSDPAMEEALYDMPLMREFAGIDIGVDVVPDESTILRFRHLLEAHDLQRAIFERINALLRAQGLMLQEGTVVDATLIAAPSSTKNRAGQRDPEMRQTKKGNQWYFGMKGHAGVDADSGLIHTVVATAANVHDVTQAPHLLHGNETDVWADSGYRGVDKREETQGLNVRWHVAMRPGQRRALNNSTLLGQVQQALEHVKARIRARGEHPFYVIKRLFGFATCPYRGLKKNAAKLTMCAALANLYMVRRKLLILSTG
ncbi:IS5 family transposase [Tepidimonas taiwanensis]|uniref:Transposase DDE domain protein n=1 Tax=Tepidimonas taiwanensis TaxID=307486 RepID=A0A554X683_9BURK|nr:IS5 family transposase [Tepidimonas taiwanensis]TSE31338.1 Transposase DDE domain protein [Tepidimonas taiwanensis]UBQ06145.1 IS5 family transposase [Tepidimonas taiwanensis]